MNSLVQVFSSSVLIGAGVWTITSLIGFGVHFLFDLINKNS